MFNQQPNWEHMPAGYWLATANLDPEFAISVIPIADSVNAYRLMCLMPTVNEDNKAGMMQWEPGRLDGPLKAVLDAAWQIGWEEFMKIHVTPAIQQHIPLS